MIEERRLRRGENVQATILIMPSCTTSAVFLGIYWPAFSGFLSCPSSELQVSIFLSFLRYSVTLIFAAFVTA